MVGHAFTETALREQEPLFQGHITGLIEQLQSRVNQKMDLNMWIDCVVADTLGDLVYGESFDSVQKGRQDPYIQDLYLNTNRLPFIQMSWDYAPLRWTFELIMSYLPFAKSVLTAGPSLNAENVAKRMELDAYAKKDFMSYVSYTKGLHL